MLTCDLYNYYEFFEKILIKVCRVFIKQMVSVLELRHIFGFVIDDDGQPVPLEEEVKIFERAQTKIQRDYPLFQIKIIVTGLKIIGKDHIEKMMNSMKAAMKTSNLVVGFDMVNEEDTTPPIKDFVQQIMQEQAKGNFPVFLHGMLFYTMLM